MKKFFLLSALISLAIFTACNKQEIEKDIVHVKEDVKPSPSTDAIEDIDESDGKAIFTIDHRENSLFEKDALLLTNKSENAVSYHWDFGNGDTSTEANPAYEYKMHGTYKVTLTVTDANDRIHQVSDEIFVLCVFGDTGVHDL